MEKMNKAIVTTLIALFQLFFVQGSFAQSQPRDFVKAFEVVSPSDASKDIALGDVIDRQSNVRIRIDIPTLQKQMNTHSTDRVTLRIEAKIHRKDGKAQPIEVDNYSSLSEEETKASKSAKKNGEGTQAEQGEKRIVFRYHDKPYDRGLVGGKVQFLGILPDSYINLQELGVNPGDRLFIKITDTQTQSDVDYIAVVGELGWNVKVTDSFFLLKRFGVSKEEESNGIKAINFRPAPGFNFGWIYTARQNRFLKFLNPGVGYNVSFTDWNEPAFDPSSGQFVKGTDSNKIEITTGPVASLFDNTLQFTYGWNLNVRSDRRYFGIGFSFFKLSEKIAGLIKK